MPSPAVGLFEAKTRLSEFVARAEAGEEVIIMRHNKPVAKIVPLHAKADAPAQAIPPFVQRTFHTGVPLVDLIWSDLKAQPPQYHRLGQFGRRAP